LYKERGRKGKGDCRRNGKERLLEKGRVRKGKGILKKKVKEKGC
jgi:hypothetical protein